MLDDIHGNIGNQNALKLDEKAESSLNMRCILDDKDDWKKAAKLSKAKNMSQWIIKILNLAAKKELKKHV